MARTKLGTRPSSTTSPQSPFRDPITGDELTRLEFLVRQVQVVVRTPWFIVAFNLITLAMVLLGHPDAWNYLASWLAIIVEWLVGTYMFGQTGRDAVYIRKIVQLIEMNEKQLEHLENLVAKSEPGRSGQGQAEVHRDVLPPAGREPREAPPESGGDVVGYYPRY